MCSLLILQFMQSMNSSMLLLRTGNNKENTIKLYLYSQQYSKVFYSNTIIYRRETLKANNQQVESTN